MSRRKSHSAAKAAESMSSDASSLTVKMTPKSPTKAQRWQSLSGAVTLVVKTFLNKGVRGAASKLNKDDIAATKLVIDALGDSLSISLFENGDANRPTPAMQLLVKYLQSATEGQAKKIADELDVLPRDRSSATEQDRASPFYLPDKIWLNHFVSAFLPRVDIRGFGFSEEDALLVRGLKSLSPLLRSDALDDSSGAFNLLSHSYWRCYNDRLERSAQRIDNSVDESISSFDKSDVSKLEHALAVSASALNVSEETVRRAWEKAGLITRIGDEIIQPTELWKDRNRKLHETAPVFAKRVYAKWVGKELTMPILRRVDFGLYQALAQHKSRESLDFDFLNASSVTDAELQQRGIRKLEDVRKQVQGSDLASRNEVNRLESAVRQRAKRPKQNKKVLSKHSR
jgi:hypothetical protein